MKIEFFKYGVEFNFGFDYFIIAFCKFEISYTKIQYDGFHKDLKLGFIEINWGI